MSMVVVRNSNIFLEPSGNGQCKVALSDYRSPNLLHKYILILYLLVFLIMLFQNVILETMHHAMHMFSSGCLF